MSILYHSRRQSRKKPRDYFLLTMTILLVFTIVQCVSFKSTYTAELPVAESFNPEKQHSLASITDRLSRIIIAGGKQLGIRFQTQFSSPIFKHGTIKVHKFNRDQEESLKKMIGWIFCPLFACFSHPFVCLFVLFSLSVLYIIFDDVRNKERKEDSVHRPSKNGSNCILTWK
ncbi:MAG: hypothetical protein JXC33_00545 [Deltaproteobacteria bacterium]|nr:hypothetical protein [Deltaproteobacteria bacterium]